MFLEQLSAVQRKALKKLWTIIPHARLVGGCVRDMLLGKALNDIDLATPLKPDEMMRVLRQAGIKVVPTGLSHGTVMAIIEGVHCEITTLRMDVVTDGRHAQVAFTRDWSEDARRRDFTINALYMDRNGEIYDYFNGVADLKKGIVRFVGDGEQRIEEDGLRILRFFRFYGRFAKSAALCRDAILAVKKKRFMLDRISAERIHKELFQIFSLPKSRVETLYLMHDTGVLERIFTQGYQLAPIKRFITWGGPTNPLLFLTAISYAPQASAQQLKLSNKEQRFVQALNNPDTPVVPRCDPSIKDIRCLIACFGHEIALLRLWLYFIKEDRSPQDVQHFKRVCARLMAQPEIVFPLTGRDIIAMGMPTGPKVGDVLRDVEHWWMAHACLPNHEACKRQALQFSRFSKSSKKD